MYKKKRFKWKYLAVLTPFHFLDILFPLKIFLWNFFESNISSISKIAFSHIFSYPRRGRIAQNLSPSLHDIHLDIFERHVTWRNGEFEIIKFVRNVRACFRAAKSTANRNVNEELRESYLKNFWNDVCPAPA